jgi:hypothetical protein
MHYGLIYCDEPGQIHRTAQDFGAGEKAITYHLTYHLTLSPADENKVRMSYQHLEFSRTKSDSTYPVYILILQD